MNRTRILLSLVLASLAPAGLSAADGALSLSLSPDATEISACLDSTLGVDLMLSNPEGLDVGGYQVFLRYSAQYFKAVRYESLSVNGFVQADGPAPVGTGYKPCDGDPSDGWSDLAGEDVFSVVATVYGSGELDPFRETAATLGRFIFQPNGEPTEGDGALFAVNEEPCRAGFSTATTVFDPAGADLGAVAPSSFSAKVIAAGPVIEILTCQDLGSSVLLEWVPPASGFSGFRVYRTVEGERIQIAELPIPGVVRFEDKAIPTGTGSITYEVALILPGGTTGCSKSCVVERESAVAFIRGDANGDGKVNVTDAVAVLNHLFRGVAIRCEDAGDFDDRGDLNLTDAVGILNFLFASGEKASPPAPFPDAGFDPTTDELVCEAAD